MVGKLMKYELRAIMRVLMWFMIAVALLSIAARGVFELQNAYGAADNGRWVVWRVLSSYSTASFWFCSLVALSVAGTVMCLVRYFKSLFTGEGYMTFSLPVTPTQLLVAKFLSALIVTVACEAEIVLSIFIALPTQAAASLMGELFSSIFPQLSAFFASEPLLAAELAVLSVVLIPAGLVYLFLIASIGQLFTKGRVIITIGLYYGASFALSLLLSIFLVPIVQLGVLSGHLVMWLFILGVAAFDVGGFFAIRYILSRKVNLVV